MSRGGGPLRPSALASPSPAAPPTAAVPLRVSPDGRGGVASKDCVHAPAARDSNAPASAAFAADDERWRGSSLRAFQSESTAERSCSCGGGVGSGWPRPEPFAEDRCCCCPHRRRRARCAGGPDWYQQPAVATVVTGTTEAATTGADAVGVKSSGRRGDFVSIPAEDAAFEATIGCGSGGGKHSAAAGDGDSDCQRTSGEHGS